MPPWRGSSHTRTHFKARILISDAIDMSGRLIVAVCIPRSSIRATERSLELLASRLFSRRRAELRGALALTVCHRRRRWTGRADASRRLDCKGRPRHRNFALGTGWIRRQGRAAECAARRGPKRRQAFVPIAGALEGRGGCRSRRASLVSSQWPHGLETSRPAINASTACLSTMLAHPPLDHILSCPECHHVGIHKLHDCWPLVLDKHEMW